MYCNHDTTLLTRTLLAVTCRTFCTLCNNADCVTCSCLCKRNPSCAGVTPDLGLVSARANSIRSNLHRTLGSQSWLRRSYACTAVRRIIFSQHTGRSSTGLCLCNQRVPTDWPCTASEETPVHCFTASRSLLYLLSYLPQVYP